MKILNTKTDDGAVIEKALTAETAFGESNISDIVKSIIQDVKAGGDKCLLELGRKFDSPMLDSLKVSEEEIKAAYDDVDESLITALKKAKENIYNFHSNQVQNSWKTTQNGCTYGQIIRPIDTVGVYAPGGLACYPSTVLMTCVPAIVAGVRHIIMCAPCAKDGKMSSAMLVAADMCGVKDIFKIGGAGAVAAMAFGTESVPRVDKIVGPGNAFVAEAKRQLFGVVGIDQVAGPSEILVIADKTSDPYYVAADMLSQAEHAKDSRCVCVTDSAEIAEKVIEETKKQTEGAMRADCIEASLEKNGIIVICRDIDECCYYANVFAPEHLEIQTEDSWAVVPKIKNAGTIMVGKWTPVPVCDFAAGPNHTLPTNGTARFSSALSVDDYIKKSGILSFEEEGLKNIAPTALKIADTEGFEAHGETMRKRFPNEKM
ncbi:MAG: histidinol dehydrogenase [Armatimonadetes bacterium]|nr:histidinol dehydrogenase [Candidatus Hippobium faecium]